MAAIELSGVVKRFGPITAVDGLDLEVPEGICLGLLGPNGAGKSTTMRLLTGQAIADAGELRVLGRELPAESKSARAAMGVVPQLDNLDIDVTVEDNLAVYARLYRVEDVGAAVDRALDLARLRDRRARRRRRALRRDAQAAAARPRAGPRPRARPPRRADRRPRSADPHRALVADRPAAQRGQDDPDVDPLHRGGGAARRRGRGDGGRARSSPATARPSWSPNTRARQTAEVYGPRNAWPRCGPTPRTSASPCAPPALRSRSSAPSAPANGQIPEEAIVRAATLEDVFVLLTGEEAE